MRDRDTVKIQLGYIILAFSLLYQVLRHTDYSLHPKLVLEKATNLVANTYKERANNTNIIPLLEHRMSRASICHGNISCTMMETIGSVRLIVLEGSDYIHLFNIIAANP